MGDRGKTLDNYDVWKAFIHDNFEKLPEYYKTRITILDNFFSENQPPVDIAIIIEDGFVTGHYLDYHIYNNNLLFYNNLSENNSTLSGEPHPDRTLLLWDTSIATIDPIADAAKYFENLGYSPSKMFVYLDEGYTDPDKHELISIDDLLRK